MSSGCSPVPISLIGRAEFFFDSDYDPAARRAIEFGQNQPADIDRLLELLRLENGILAGGRIEN